MQAAAPARRNVVPGARRVDPGPITIPDRSAGPPAYRSKTVSRASAVIEPGRDVLILFAISGHNGYKHPIID
jgi:hypothetical protein